MKKVCVLVDSTCDISFPLDNIDIIRRRIKVSGETGILLDDNEANYDYYLKMAKKDVKVSGISYDDYFSALEKNYKNGIYNLMILVPSMLENEDYNTFKRVVNDFNEIYGVNVKLISTGLNRGALGLLVNDVNDLINQGYTIEEIEEYINNNKHLYVLYYCPEVIDNVRLNSEDKIKILSARKKGEDFVLKQEYNQISKVVSCKKSIYGSSSLIFELIKYDNNISGNLLVGKTYESSDSDALEERIYQEMDYEDILSTIVSKSTGIKYGKKSLFLAYKKSN